MGRHTQQTEIYIIGSRYEQLNYDLKIQPQTCSGRRALTQFLSLSLFFLSFLLLGQVGVDSARKEIVGSFLP